MPRQITTVTPENVQIDYELAGVASRCGAALIDLLIQIITIALVVFAYSAAEYYLKFSMVAWPTSVLIIGGFLLWWGYYVFFETRWNGQTPAKRLMRLRVVRYGGMPVDLSCAALRALVRAVDFGLVLVGAVFMLFTPRTQRLGDFAAGTLVVKERGEWKGDLQRTPSTAVSRDSHEMQIVTNIELVTAEQFDAIRRFVDREPELHSHVKEQIAARLAEPLMRSLGIPNGGITYSKLLIAIYTKCVQERGMR